MIRVNDVTIDQAAVAREMQHHPAETRDEAERQAQIALVVRELLLQRAAQREIAGASEEERLATLVDLEVRVPEATDEEVARYYRRNGLKFMTPAVYQAAHIFFPARRDDEDLRREAKSRAEHVLAEVQAEPARFADLAKVHSACASKDQGGSLGQVKRGDTNAEVEQALARMDEGGVELVASRHGFHVLRLDRRAVARQLPLEQVETWIRDHLRKTSKRRAIAQYLQLLAAQAKISGIDLAAASSPLVQ